MKKLVLFAAIVAAVALSACTKKAATEPVQEVQLEEVIAPVEEAPAATDEAPVVTEEAPAAAE
jgi:outer membrane lipoprotein-sorting protein